MSDLRDALEMLELGDWLEQFTDLRNAGGDEVRIQDCPECLNDEWKLYINTAKQRWICYVCEWGRDLGDPVRLMAAVSGRSAFSIRLELMATVIPSVPSTGYNAALEAAFGNVYKAIEDEPELENIDLPGYDQFTGITTRSVLDYALSRGLTEQDVKDNQLRAATKLQLNKYEGKPVEIEGPFLVFPVFCAGKSVSWQGRKIEKTDIPYISASNVKDWLWPLSPQFFQCYTNSWLVLVEGVFDALGFLRLGIPALCTFGKSMSDKQLELLRDLYIDKIIFAWDTDAYKAMAKAVDRVSYVFPQTSVIDFSVGVTGKVDAGDSLARPEVGPWLLERLDNAMDVHSAEFFQWRMLKA